jgi:hypothetical protein
MRYALRALLLALFACLLTAAPAAAGQTISAKVTLKR